MLRIKIKKNRSVDRIFLYLRVKIFVMKKIQLLFFLVLIACTVSCKSGKNQTVDNNPVKKFDEKTFDPYFKGLGTEPFWNIEVGTDFIVYKDIDNNLEVFPVNNIEKAQDANIQLITAENNNHEIRLTLTQQECSDGMSDNTFSFKTKVEISGKDHPLTLNGCGNYIVPKKLQGKWELSHFNGNEIPENKYLKTPYLEFEDEEQRVTGNASCNGINGGIFIQNDIIRFSKLAVTRMMCVHENMEQEFLAELPKITNYKIINNELQLFSGGVLKMKMKKKH